MLNATKTVLGLTMCLSCVSQVAGQEPAGQPKLRVELRWVESKPVEGLTETEGFQTSCDPNDIVYPHKKPALVLTAREVEKTRFTEHTLGRLGVQYMVRLHLTKEARDKLAASCEGNKMRLLTVRVEDKYWGIRRYEKDPHKKFVPAQARAETFTPDVGLFASYGEAHRLANAFQ